MSPQLDLVLAILRARQLFGGEQTVPGLRQALGLAEDGTDDRAAVDEAETRARALLAELQQSGWDAGVVDSLTDDRDVAAILRFACHRGGAPSRGHRGGDRSDPASVGRPVHRRGTLGFAAAGAGQRAADRAQLLLRRPQGRAVAAGMGDRQRDGRVAAGPLPHGPRQLAAVGRPFGLGHIGDADVGR